jgi:hypothetical protein
MQKLQLARVRFGRVADIPSPVTENPQQSRAYQLQLLTRSLKACST